MFKQIIFKTALVCATLGPAVGLACVEGNLAVRTLERDYAGITALPVARYLGLDDSCNGRRLNSIVLNMLSSGGPGYATLIVNGSPVGPSQIVGSTMSSYEFKLDPDFNYIGNHVNVHTMEVRLSGSFYIDSVEGHLGTDSENYPWSNWGIHLASIKLVDKLTTTTVQFEEEYDTPARILFVAREDEVKIKKVTVNFTDGTHLNYGPGYLKPNEASRIDINHECKCKHVSSIDIVARAGDNCEDAILEVRTKNVDDDK